MREQRAALRRLRIEYQDGKIVLVGSEGAVAIITGNVGFPSSESDARRIVACVNACEGLSTECLETMPIAENAGEIIERLEKQRDELLAAPTSIDELIAATLRDLKPIPPNGVESQLQWLKSIHALADVCAASNPNFNRSHFLEACGSKSS